MVGEKSVVAEFGGGRKTNDYKISRAGYDIIIGAVRKKVMSSS